MVPSNKGLNTDGTHKSFDFEDFNVGSVNGQHGWTHTGSHDFVVTTAHQDGFSEFGSKMLRVSNAVMTLSLANQMYAPEMIDEAGETNSQNGGKWAGSGTRRRHWEAHWRTKSYSSTEQIGLRHGVRGCRGDGSTMTRVETVDRPDGLAVIFYDVYWDDGNFKGWTGDEFRQTYVDLSVLPASSLDNTMAYLDRSKAHSFRLTIDFVDGVGNDVGKLYIDDVLVHTGTSWEDYWVYGAPKLPSARTIDTMSFTIRGTTHESNATVSYGHAVPANSGKGYYIDGVRSYVTGFSTCNDCAACPAGQYISKACTGGFTDDRQCTPCISACTGPGANNAGEYIAKTCTGKDTQINTCSSCPGCPDGQYLSKSCTGTTTASNRECLPCTWVENADLAGGTEASVARCTASDNTRVLSGCVDGYWLDGSGKADVCVECTPVEHMAGGTQVTCSSADDSQIVECEPGYRVVDAATGADTCEPCPTGCFACDGSAANCDLASCNAGYTRSDSTQQCIPDPCEPTFTMTAYHDDGCAALVTNAAACTISCTGNTVPASKQYTCPDGVFTGAALVCTPCPSNCKSCDAATGCTECNAGYNKIGVSNSFQCTAADCAGVPTGAGYEECDLVTDGQCIHRCKPGYYGSSSTASYTCPAGVFTSSLAANAALVCQPCTAIANAASSAAVTCRTALDSQLTGACKALFWLQTSGTADKCVGCTPIYNCATGMLVCDANAAGSAAIITCTKCNEGFELQEGGTKCKAKPTCFDGLVNQGENSRAEGGPDCGGPACQACAANAPPPPPETAVVAVTFAVTLEEFDAAAFIDDLSNRTGIPKENIRVDEVIADEAGGVKATAIITGDGSVEKAEEAAEEYNTPGEYIAIGKMEVTGAEYKVGECVSKPCDDAATCTEKASGHTCSCKDGFEGDGKPSDAGGSGCTEPKDTSEFAVWPIIVGVLLCICVALAGVAAYRNRQNKEEKFHHASRTHSESRSRESRESRDDDDGPGDDGPGDDDDAYGYPASSSQRRSGYTPRSTSARSSGADRSSASGHWEQTGDWDDLHTDSDSA